MHENAHMIMRKSLFFRITLISLICPVFFVRIIFSADALGGVGGLSRIKKMIGKDHTVMTILLTRTKVKNLSRPCLSHLSPGVSLSEMSGNGSK